MSSTLYAIDHLHFLQDRWFNRHLHHNLPYRLNAGQARLLMCLWEGDGIPIRELCARSFLQKTTVSTMLPHMEQAGLVWTGPSPTDGRVRLVYLTEEARCLREIHYQAEQKIESILFAGVNDEDKEIFFRTLQKIKENISKEGEADD